MRVDEELRVAALMLAVSYFTAMEVEGLDDTVLECAQKHSSVKYLLLNYEHLAKQHGLSEDSTSDLFLKSLDYMYATYDRIMVIQEEKEKNG